MNCSKCGNQHSENGYCDKCIKSKSGIVYCLGNIEPKFNYLFAIIFFLLSDFILKSVFVSFFEREIQSVFLLIINFIDLAIFSITMIFFIQIKGENKLINKIGNSIVNTIIFLIILYTWYSCIGYLYLFLSNQFLNLINNSKMGIFIVLFMVLSIIFLEILLTCSIILYFILQRKNSFFATISSSGTLFIKTVLNVLKHPILLLISCLLISITLFVGQNILMYINSVCDYLIPISFISKIVSNIVAAILNSYCIYYLYNFSNILISKNENLIVNNSKNIIPIYPIICVVIMGFTLIMYNPLSNDSYLQFKNKIQEKLNKAEIMSKTTLDAQAARLYYEAYSEILSVRGYCSDIMREKTKSNKVSGDEDYKNALKLDNSNALVSLFKGNKELNNKNYKEALRIYKESIKNVKADPDCFLNGYVSSCKIESKENNDKANFKHWIIKNNYFESRWNQFYSYDEDKLENCIIDLKKMEQEIEPLLADVFYSMVLKGEYQKAIDNLEDLKKKYPKDPKIYYYLCQIYSEVRNESSNYSKCIANIEGFLENYKNRSEYKEKDCYQYAASIYEMANKIDKAEEFSEKAYNLSKKDLDCIEKYINILIKVKKNDVALKLIDETRNMNIDSLNLVYYKSMIYLNKEELQDSFKEIVKINNYKENHKEYDKVLYQYSLAISSALKTKEDIEKLEQIESDEIKNYSKALINWRSKDSESSNKLLDEVLSSDLNLGFAWYCKAINYYEQAVRTNSNDFALAIESYQKSVKINPEYVETYFALGHCFKKAGKLESALNCFRKTVDLLPFEDHRVDPYGMTVHAKGVIDELKASIGRDGV